MLKNRKKPATAKALDTEAALWQYALRLLARRAYSAAELEAKCRARAATETQLAAVTARLSELKLVDDARLAAALYAGWLEKKVYGRRHLEALLTKRGLGPSLVAAILADFSEEKEEEHACAALAEFRRLNAAKLAAAVSFAERRRMGAAALRYLDSRGFSRKYFAEVRALVNAEAEPRD